LPHRIEPGATGAARQRGAGTPCRPGAHAASDDVLVFGRRPGPTRYSGERALEAEATELMAKKKKGKKKKGVRGNGKKKKR
jgi:hypothetical protein